jgi:hypothetical protein
MLRKEPEKQNASKSWNEQWIWILRHHMQKLLAL